MNPREPLIGFVFALFLLVLWLGFLFHRDERFAGTMAGGILAISGSVLLLIPFIYSVVKRVPFLKLAFTKVIPFQTFLTIHIYAGFIGAILVLLHTGHKFHGVLATSLTALLLIVVFSGYVGRYLLSRISKEVAEKKQLLSRLESQFARKLGEFQQHSQASEILKLAESTADVEFAISTHDIFKNFFSKWLKFHIVLSVLFYVLLALHIGGEYYFGLRWFE